MEGAFKKTLFGSMALLALLGTLALASAFKPRFADLAAIRGRIVKKLFAEHVKSFGALEDLLQVYLSSYRGAMQESLLIESRWLDELRKSGDIEGADSGRGAPGAILAGAGGGIRFYIDGNGAFHLVSAIGGADRLADLIVGFGPLADEMGVLVRKPKGVALLDTKNKAAARVYGRTVGRTGKPRVGRPPDGIEIRFAPLCRVRVSKEFGFGGEGLVLVSEYGCMPSGGGVISWGLFVLFVLAILIAAAVGASLHGGIPIGRRIMREKAGASDIVDQIDREISGGHRAGPEPRTAEGSEENAPVSIEEGLAEEAGRSGARGEAVGPGANAGKRAAADVLEKDGITIRKS